MLAYVCCDLDSRGVSFADGKILFSQLDGYLSALDAQTGKLLWKSKVVDYKDGETNTSPPLTSVRVNSNSARFSRT